MKKILVTILALVYLTVSSGATINMHYCMGKLMDWDLAKKQNSICGTCGMEKSAHKGCCKDEQKKLQIEKDQKISESSFHVLNTDAGIIISTYFLPAYSASVSIEQPVSHAPPGWRSVPIFIRNCSFRI